MNEDVPNKRRFYAVSYQDDIPQDGRGLLIPTKSSKRKSANHFSWSALTPLLVIPLLTSVMYFSGNAGLAALGSFSITNETDLPPIVLLDGASAKERPLNYGVEVAMSSPSFFAETRDAFVDARSTFIEADLEVMQLRYFESGVLTLSLPILSKGAPGSWWQTPAGIYQVEVKKDNHYSTFGQIYQPWSMAFQGNFSIHGWPNYVDGTPVPESYTGGCIRLSNEDAETLYNAVTVSTPILVHDTLLEPDTFLYEPRIPNLNTPHYLIADVDSSTILAASDVDAVAPIASVTKLMTALVAAEYINLDTSVSVSTPTFVQSLVPRLGERSRVSMYSLLQLLLVESSNEASEVIAAQLGREQFIERMNHKAKALGMLSTNFADPSGLSADNTSSLSDLLRLTQYIYNNRSFILELTANQNLPTAYVSGEFGELINFNKIENLENFIGGKVGETIAAGQTSVSLHTLEVKGQKRVLAVIVLGSQNRNQDVLQLLNYAIERFSI